MDSYQKVRDYLLALEYDIISSEEEEQLFVVSNEDKGVMNLLLDVEDGILIMEQHIFTLKEPKADILMALMAKNRELVHGAFAIDQDTNRVFWRDTLEVENLDINELEASLNALGLMFSEYFNELIDFAKN